MHARGERAANPSEKPLLWTNTANGGRQYFYMRSEEDILKRAWEGTHFGATPPRAKSCAQMAQEKLCELLTKGVPLGEWTANSADLLFPDLSSKSEE